jgi:hypothetical protein
VLLGAVVFGKRILPKPEEVHIHAGFIVYNNGKQEDFSDFRYMEVKPCGGDHQEKLTAEEEQREKAHLHDGIGDVVHVHRKGAKWGDLFKNINYPVVAAKLNVYINGELIRDSLTREIVPYESIIFVVGSVDGIDLTKQVAREHIEETERKSELCGSDEQ